MNFLMTTSNMNVVKNNNTINNNDISIINITSGANSLSCYVVSCDASMNNVACTYGVQNTYYSNYSPANATNVILYGTSVRDTSFTQKNLTAYVPSNPSGSTTFTYVSSNGTYFLYGSDTNLYLSSGGPNGSLSSTPILTASNILISAFISNDGQRIFALSNRYLYKSTNAGQNFTLHDPGYAFAYQNNFKKSLACSDDGLYVMCTGLSNFTSFGFIFCFDITTNTFFSINNTNTWGFPLNVSMSFSGKYQVFCSKTNPSKTYDTSYNLYYHNNYGKLTDFSLILQKNNLNNTTSGTTNTQSTTNLDYGPLVATVSETSTGSCIVALFTTTVRITKDEGATWTIFYLPITTTTLSNINFSNYDMCLSDKYYLVALSTGTNYLIKNSHDQIANGTSNPLTQNVIKTNTFSCYVVSCDASMNNVACTYGVQNTYYSNYSPANATNVILYGTSVRDTSFTQKNLTAYVPSNPSGSTTFTYVSSNGTYFLYGSDTNLYLSSGGPNGSLSSTPILTASNILISAFISNDGQRIFALSNRYLHKSTNAGQNFTLHDTGYAFAYQNNFKKSLACSDNGSYVMFTGLSNFTSFTNIFYFNNTTNTFSSINDKKIWGYPLNVSMSFSGKYQVFCSKTNPTKIYDTSYNLYYNNNYGKEPYFALILQNNNLNNINANGTINTGSTTNLDYGPLVATVSETSTGSCIVALFTTTVRITKDEGATWTIINLLITTTTLSAINFSNYDVCLSDKYYLVALSTGGGNNFLIKAPHDQIANGTSTPFTKTTLTFTTTQTFTPTSSFNALVLLVGGGGGGGEDKGSVAPGSGSGAGGGGGGGVGMGVITFISGTTYTITIGNGGASFSNGDDSSIIGGLINEIAYGGGRGGSSYSSSGGDPGGSGGGGCGMGYSQNGGTSRTGTGSFLIYYGNNGGTGTYQKGGGSGGGAGGVGLSSSNENGANGGNGILWTSNNITYGGGGGGGSKISSGSGGSGGSGGGGSGGSDGISTVKNGKNGTINTGGGGGGSSRATNINDILIGGTGGSGICVLMCYQF